jgi:hypothetical protein
MFRGDFVLMPVENNVLHFKKHHGIRFFVALAVLIFAGLLAGGFYALRPKADQGLLTANNAINLEKSFPSGVASSKSILFNADTTFKERLTVDGNVEILGSIKVKDNDIDLGTGSIYASNIIKKITASQGISVSGTQELVLQNTGVTSIQGQTGNVVFTPSEGIKIDGSSIGLDTRYISNFTKIDIDGNSFQATGSDTLRFKGTAGVLVTTDPTTKTIQLSADTRLLNVSGWEDNSNIITLSDSSSLVGIGTSSPEAKLHVIGSTVFEGESTIRGNLFAYGTATINGDTLVNGILTVQGINLTNNGITNAGAITGASGFTSSGTITLSELGSGIVKSNFNGVLSSSPLDLENDMEELTGVLQLAHGGTGISSYNKGDLIIASSTEMMETLGIGAPAQVLTVSEAGLPTWGTLSGSLVCPNCLVRDPGSNQTITPSANNITGLVVAKGAAGTADIFKVTDNSGTNAYLRVDGSGNVILGQNSLSTGTFSISPDNSDPITITPNSLGTDYFAGTITTNDLTQARTWKFPDASGVVCLSIGNCTGTAAALGGSGTENYLARWSEVFGLQDSMVYDNGTNVGIGTNSPSAKLSVNGSFTSGAALFTETLGVSGAVILSDTLEVSGNVDLDSTLGVTGAATLSSTLNVTGLTTVGGNLNVNGAGSSFIMGKLGIGTNNPAGLLDIRGATAATPAQVWNGDGTLIFSAPFSGNDSYTYLKNMIVNEYAIVNGNLTAGANAVNIYQNNWTTSTLDITPTWTNSAATYNAISLNVTNTASASDSALMNLKIGGTSQFVVRKDGKVGIGSTTPFTNTTLSVNSVSATNTGIAVRANSSQTASLFEIQKSDGSPLVSMNPFFASGGSGYVFDSVNTFNTPTAPYMNGSHLTVRNAGNDIFRLWKRTGASAESIMTLSSANSSNVFETEVGGGTLNMYFSSTMFLQLAGEKNPVFQLPTAVNVNARSLLSGGGGTAQFAVAAPTASNSGIVVKSTDNNGTRNAFSIVNSTNTEKLALNPFADSSTGATNYIFDTNSTVAANGNNNLFAIKNNGTSLFRVTTGGTYLSSQVIMSAGGNAVINNGSPAFVVGNTAGDILQATNSGGTLLWKVAGGTGNLVSNVSDSASAVGFTFDTQNNLTTAGSKLISVKNAGTERLYISGNGDFYADGTGHSMLDLRDEGQFVISHSSAAIKLTSNETLAGGRWTPNYTTTLASRYGDIGISSSRYRFDKQAGGGSLYFETTDHIAFGYNAGTATFTESMRLTSAGNLGLGTTTTSGKLHVEQAGNATPALALTLSGASPTYFYTQTSRALVSPSNSLLEIGNQGATSQQGYLGVYGISVGDYTYYTKSTSTALNVIGRSTTDIGLVINGVAAQTSDFMQIRSTTAATNGDVFTVDANKRVGIGTATPSDTLSVQGTSSFSSTATFAGNIHLGSNAVGITRKTGNNLAFEGRDAITFNLDLVNGVGGKAERARFDSNGNLGLGTSAPTHALTLPTGSTGIALYNTVDQTTNTELGTIGWSGNNFTVNVAKSGTGAQRGLKFAANGSNVFGIDPTNNTFHVYNSGIRFAADGGTSPSITTDSQGGVAFTANTASAPDIQSTFAFQSNNITKSGGSFTDHYYMWAPSTFAPTSGSQNYVGLNLAPTINQTGTASGSYTALQVNVTETAVLGTSRKLADFQVGGTSSLRINANNTIASPTLQFGANSTGIYLPSANTLGFVAGNVNVMNLSSSSTAFGGGYFQVGLSANTVITNGSNDKELYFIGGSNVGKGIKFATGTATPTVGMVLDGNGRVGIGAAVPTYQLDVNGIMRSNTLITGPDGTRYIIGNINGLALQSTTSYGWGASSTDAGGAKDTGVSRLSANKVGIGNGTGGDYSGTLITTSLGVNALTPNYTLDVNGDINSSSLYRVAGTAGINLSCGADLGIKSLTVSGGIVTAGACTTNTLTDLAEYYGSDDASIESGDIVSISSTQSAVEVATTSGPATKAYIEKSSELTQDAVIGIVSTNPEIKLGAGLFDANENPRAVALSGRVPVKVTSANGAIKKGDAITLSPISGVGMKYTGTGTVIGKALQDYDSLNKSAIKKIIVFVHLSYTTAGNNSQNTGLAWQQSNDVLSTDYTVQINGSLTAQNAVFTTISTQIINVNNSSVVIDSNGTITTKGTVIAQAIEAAQASITTLTTETIVIAPNTQTGDSNVGDEVLLANTTTQFIPNKNITKDSYVFITTKTPGAPNISVVSLLPGKGYSIDTSSPVGFDVVFSFLIIDKQFK